MAFMNGEKPPITQKLTFEPPKQSGFSDKPASKIAAIDVTTGAPQPGAAAATASASPAELFTRLDDDKSGWLDKAEVKDSADVDGNWSRFENNGDGRISREEFTAGYTIEPKR